MTSESFRKPPATEHGSGDALGEVIERAVESGFRRALNIHESTSTRLYTVKQAAAYLALSTREIYNMIESGELSLVKHGRRNMLDKRDLDIWIEQNKINKGVLKAR